MYFKCLLKDNGFTLKKARSRRYSTETIMDADNAGDIALLANLPNHAKSLLPCVPQAAGGIVFQVNVDKTEYMCFNQGDIPTLNGGSLKLVDKFMYLGSSVSSAKSDIKMNLAKA